MAAVAVHIARIVPLRVLSNGTTVKSKEGLTIAEVMNSNEEFRVAADPANANTANNPTIEAYIIAEAASGFKVQFINQTWIVSYPA